MGTDIVHITSLNNVVEGNVGLPILYETKSSYMKNTSGGALAAGDVVILKSVAACDEVTTTTTGGDDKVFGIATAAIADNAYGFIQTKGKTALLKVNGTSDIAIGDYLSTFTTAKIAKKAVDGEQVFAIALEAYSTDDSDGEDPLGWAFGELGTTDRARHLASLFIDDLADVLRDGIDPRFELSRYGERLASSAPSFDALAEALDDLAHAPGGREVRVVGGEALVQDLDPRLGHRRSGPRGRVAQLARLGRHDDRLQNARNLTQ